jgi:hypothetical protein
MPLQIVILDMHEMGTKERILSSPLLKVRASTQARGVQDVSVLPADGLGGFDRVRQHIDEPEAVQDTQPRTTGGR